MLVKLVLRNQLTVTTWLDRSFDIADALDCDTVLIVAVDELIFKLADFVDQDTQLIRHIRDVVVASFAPDGELLLLRLVSIYTKLVSS